MRKHRCNEMIHRKLRNLSLASDLHPLSHLANFLRSSATLRLVTRITSPSRARLPESRFVVRKCHVGRTIYEKSKLQHCSDFAFWYVSCSRLSVALWFESQDFLKLYCDSPLRVSPTSGSAIRNSITNPRTSIGRSEDLPLGMQTIRGIKRFMFPVQTILFEYAGHCLDHDTCAILSR